MNPLGRANKLALSINETAQATSLSISTIDTAIRAGILPVRRYGNRTLVLMRDLERWLESLPTGRPDAPPQLEGRRTGRPKRYVISNPTGE